MVCFLLLDSFWLEDRLQDSEAAVEVLNKLDVPYIAAHPLEFQTLSQWSSATGGLGPIETTMLVALPEIDGATVPTVFAGRHGESGECNCCSYFAKPKTLGQWLPRAYR